MLAAEYNNMHAAEALFAQGANIHLSYDNGENALLLAINAGVGSSTLKRLIEMGLDPLSPNSEGVNSLQLICRGNLYDKLDFMNYLKEQGFDMNIVDNEGNTLWHYFTGNENSNYIDIAFHDLKKFSEFL